MWSGVMAKKRATPAKATPKVESPAQPAGMADNGRIFVSFSKGRGKAVALALREMLPQLLYGVKVWVSDRDIEPGTHWFETIGRALSGHDMGVLCLTRESLVAPWILFEAGALSKALDTSRVVPYRIGVAAADVLPPLSLFQGVDANSEGTFKLVTMLNLSRREPIDTEVLRQSFDRWWPHFESKLDAVLADSDQPESPRRGVGDMVEELLSLVRGMHGQSRWNYPYQEFQDDYQNIKLLPAPPKSLPYDFFMLDATKQRRLLLIWMSSGNKYVSFKGYIYFTRALVDRVANSGKLTLESMDHLIEYAVGEIAPFVQNRTGEGASAPDP